MPRTKFPPRYPVSVLLTKEERKDAKKAAAIAGKTMTELIRPQFLGQVRYILKQAGVQGSSGMDEILTDDEKRVLAGEPGYVSSAGAKPVRGRTTDLVVLDEANAIVPGSYPPITQVTQAQADGIGRRLGESVLATAKRLSRMQTVDVGKALAESGLGMAELSLEELQARTGHCHLDPCAGPGCSCSCTSCSQARRAQAMASAPSQAALGSAGSQARASGGSQAAAPRPGASQAAQAAQETELGAEAIEQAAAEALSFLGQLDSDETEGA